VKWDAPHRVGRESHDPSPPREGVGCPLEHRNGISDPSLRSNEMSELLTAPEWNGMLLIGSEVIAPSPHLLGWEWGAPRGIGMECRDPSQRPNEMSELLTAPECNGMLLIASEGKATTPHRLGREWGAPRSIGMKGPAPNCVPMRCQNSSLRPSEMGCSSSRRRGTPRSLTASGGSVVPLRASESNLGPLTASQ
jgi:hypothetical protein